jgi:hypothetical protein
LSKWFQTRKFLWEFPIGPDVKLSSAVAAILVGVLKCRIQFWKRTTQESFQQSLVQIGSVVSEEKIFLKFDFNAFRLIFQKLVNPITNFDRLCKLEKKGDEILKKSSPLKLLSQSQPIFAEMILSWSQDG